MFRIIVLALSIAKSFASDDDYDYDEDYYYDEDYVEVGSHEWYMEQYSDISEPLCRQFFETYGAQDSFVGFTGVNSHGNSLFLDCNGGLVCEDITTCDWQQQGNGEWACVNERVIGRECDGRHDGYSGDDYLGLELELYPDELDGEMITTPYPDSVTVQMQLFLPELKDVHQMRFFDYGLHRAGATNFTLYQWMNMEYEDVTYHARFRKESIVMKTLDVLTTTSHSSVTQSKPVKMIG
jgi:hypothetical protein